MKQNLIKQDTMFKIDLLKGQGIPPKSGPAGLIIIAITALIPAVLMISLYGFYNNSKIVTKIKQQDILKLENNISKLSDAVEMKKDLEKQKVFYNACLTEVKSSIKKFTQWSPVLAILLEEMPASVVMKGLEVEHEKVKKDALNKKDQTGKKETADIIMTKLILQISNQSEGDFVEEVKDFRNRLYASPVIGSRLQNVVFSRETELNDGTEIISYKIECLFKPES